MKSKKKPEPKRRKKPASSTKMAAPKRARGASPATTTMYDHVCKLALELPGVELSTSYGTPAIKVKGKFMARLRSESEGGLAIRCDFVDRQMLMQAAPEAFYLTDHYLDYPMVLINLAEVRRDALPDLIERAWRMSAPPKLVKEYDAARKE
jgi:hypothetical protein